MMNVPRVPSGPRHVLRRALLLAAAIVVVLFAIWHSHLAMISFTRTHTTGTDTSATASIQDQNTLHFNGWIEERGLARPAPLPRAGAQHSYAFTADLGYWRASDHFPGATSFEPGPELAAFIRSAPQEQAVLSAYARPILIGRGLELLAGELNVEVWRGGVWHRLGAVDGMVPFDIDLDRMRRAKKLHSAEPADLRFAGLRFGIRSTGSGCAAVALSIWNEEKTLPLDNVVFPVTIGDAGCLTDTKQERNVAGLSRLLSEEPDARFDAALHVFEYALPGSTPGAVAIYVPAKANGDCTHYTWQTTRALSSVVSTPAFAASLDDARRNNHYDVLAGTLRSHLFPENDPEPKCGATAASQHLAALAAQASPKVFARLIGAQNEVLFMPVGIVFMAEGADGKRLFAHAPIVAQSLPRETYQVLGCVSDFAFAIPPKLERVEGTIAIEPSPLFQPIKAIPDIEAFMRKSDDKPVTFVLLAHHGDGIIYFDNPVVQWDVSFLKRSFKPGSVAVLSTCNAGNVQPSQMRLARDLNRAGIDAMLLSTFDVKPAAGIALAKNMAAELVAARGKPAPLMLLEIYEAARRKTVRELAPSVGENAAEGLMSEFTLAGDGGIRICGKEN